jgi:hypothetical protein
VGKYRTRSSNCFLSFSKTLSHNCQASAVSFKQWNKSEVSNRVVHNKERDIIRRVIEHCNEEKCMHVLIQKATAANYTGVSVATIKQIRKSCKEKPNDPQKAHRKKWLDSYSSYKYTHV